MRGSLRLLRIQKMERNYHDAIATLNSTQTPFKVLQEKKGQPRTRRYTIHGMKDYLQALGHSESDLNRLNVVHVAGTKGKGSTCAFVESFLRIHGQRTGFPKKTGLFTSPHLMSVRDRYRINFKPLSEDLFAKYFFEVWDKLSCPTAKELLNERRPSYLQFVVLLSFHIFIREGVDAAILETLCGGEHDATNVVPKPVVAGITTLGLDHIQLLGPTIEDIAWHKGGIMKHGTPAFSSTQLPNLAAVLRNRALEKEVTLKFVDIDPALPQVEVLEPDVQKKNVSLALSVAHSFLDQKEDGEERSLTSDDILRSLNQYSLPGRFQKIIEGNYQWFFDGAHNELSVQEAADWFCKTGPQKQSKSEPLVPVLIFGNISKRDGTVLVKLIAKSLQEGGVRLRHVIFTTYKERQDGSLRIDTTNSSTNPDANFALSYQERYAETWKNIDRDAEISLASSIEEALDLARAIGDRNNGMQTLVTGSLYVVGSALALLDRRILNHVPV